MIILPTKLLLLLTRVKSNTMKYLEDYLKYLKIDKNLSSKTMEVYQRDIREFQRYLGKSHSIGSIARSHIRGFLAYLTENRNQPITRRRKLTSLRNFFEYLEGEGEIKNNPAKYVVMPKVSQKEPQSISEKEIKKILSHIQKDQSRFRKRNYLMIKILAETGIRLSELTSMDTKDADTKNLNLRIKRKGGSEQEIPINKQLGRLIKNYAKNKKQSEPLFKSSFRRRITNRRVGLMFQKYVKKAGIEKKVSVHSTRHAFCTRMLDKGVNLKIIQVLAGHKSISTTERYLHIAKSKLRKEVRLAEV